MLALTHRQSCQPSRAGQGLPAPETGAEGAQQHVVQRGGGQHDARHRAEGQLKADAGRGKGVLEEQKQQGQPQGGGHVPLPAQHRGGQKHRLHHHRPHGGGGRPRHEGKEKQQGDQRQHHLPLSPAQKEQHAHQEGDVHAGHHHRVEDAGAVQGGGEGLVQPVLVPDGDGGGQGRGHRSKAAAMPCFRYRAHRAGQYWKGTAWAGRSSRGGSLQ